jgi:hypothetical protein
MRLAIGQLEDGGCVFVAKAFSRGSNKRLETRRAERDRRVHARGHIDSQPEILEGEVDAEARGKVAYNHPRETHLKLVRAGARVPQGSGQQLWLNPSLEAQREALGEQCHVPHANEIAEQLECRCLLDVAKYVEWTTDHVQQRPR